MEAGRRVRGTGLCGVRVNVFELRRCRPAACRGKVQSSKYVIMIFIVMFGGKYLIGVKVSCYKKMYTSVITCKVTQ